MSQASTPKTNDGDRGAPAYVAHEVWDRPTRVLHWTNALLTFAVLAVGFFFMFRDHLAIEGRPSKIALKQFHTVFGYALLVGVAARFAWGFFGNRHVRWSAVLPRPSTVAPALHEALAIAKNRPYRHDLGHGHAGRLSTALLFGLLTLSIGSGLVRAATDLFHPPFGGVVAAYVARPGVDPARINPFDDDLLDKGKMKNINKVKTVAGTAHRFSAWAMVGAVLLHVVGIVLKELRHGGTILSSMITGRKLMTEPPPAGDTAGGAAPP